MVLKALIARYLEGSGYTSEAASDEAVKYSGHIRCVGMYTAVCEAGIAIEAVAALARHKSLNVAQKFARRADQISSSARLPRPHTGNLRDGTARLRFTRSLLPQLLTCWLQRGGTVKVVEPRREMDV